MPDLPLGIMRTENDALENLKKEIYGRKPFQSLQTRIGELTDEDRATLVSIAKIVLAFQQATVSKEGVTDIDYASLIERLYRGLKPELKVLLADVLDEIEPVKVVPKKEVKPSGKTIYEDQRYFPKSHYQNLTFLYSSPSRTQHQNQKKNHLQPLHQNQRNNCHSWLGLKTVNPVEDQTLR